MEIIIGLKNVLQRIGCLLYDHPHNKLINIGQCCFFLSIAFIHFLSSFWFFVFEAKTFIAHVESFIPSISASLIILIYSSFLWERKDISELINELESIIETRKQPSLYQAANEKIEKWTKIQNITSIISVLCFAMPNVSLFLYGYYFTNTPDEYCRLNFPASVPFNWKSPLGYFSAMIVQSAGLFNDIMIGYCAALVPIAFCVFLIAFCYDLDNDLHLLNELIKTGSNKKREIPTNHRIEIKRELQTLIRFRCIIKQFAFKTSGIFNPMVFAIFIFTVLYYCCALLQIHVVLKSNNFVGIISPVSFTAAWMILFFMLCNFGEKVTNRFSDLSYSVYNVLWYQCPVDQQKLFILTILYGNNPVYLEGFVVQNTHVTFQKVIKTAFSYFLVLREFL